MVISHAGPLPVFCTLRVKVPGTPARMVAGPPFCKVIESGPTTVIGAVTPAPAATCVALSPSNWL